MPSSRLMVIVALGAALAVALAVASSGSGASVHGTLSNDTIRGTAAADRIYGDGGNDKIYGLGGNDTIYGNGGHDTIYGNGGNDTIYASFGNYRIIGGPGTDTIYCGSGVQRVTAGRLDRVYGDCEFVARPPTPSAPATPTVPTKPTVRTTPAAPATATAPATPPAATVPAKPAKAETTFENGVLTTPDVKIEITDHKIVPAGAEGNEYGDKPVLALWYKTTNVSGKDVNPLDFMFHFRAYQDNNPNAYNELDFGVLFSDDRFRDSQTENIKKGGTVENAVAYELDDLTTPVKLVALKSLLGDKVGSVTYNLK